VIEAYPFKIGSQYIGQRYYFLVDESNFIRLVRRTIREHGRHASWIVEIDGFFITTSGDFACLKSRSKILLQGGFGQGISIPKYGKA